MIVSTVFKIGCLYWVIVLEPTRPAPYAFVSELLLPLSCLHYICSNIAEKLLEIFT